MTQFTVINCDVCDKRLDNEYNELNDNYHYKIKNRHSIYTKSDVCNQCLIDMLIKKIEGRGLSYA